MSLVRWHASRPKQALGGHCFHRPLPQWQLAGALCPRVREYWDTTDNARMQAHHIRTGRPGDLAIPSPCARPNTRRLPMRKPKAREDDSRQPKQIERSLTRATNAPTRSSAMGRFIRLLATCLGGTSQRRVKACDEDVEVDVNVCAYMCMDVYARHQDEARMTERGLDNKRAKNDDAPTGCGSVKAAPYFASRRRSRARLPLLEQRV